MIRSVVEYYAEHESYRCGYCKSIDTNFSHGMWAHVLTVKDYQDLIDRGWRRSGKYCYKPTMDVTCCPMYTIRCRALEFKATKSQKKVLKRFNRFLMGEDNLAEFKRKMSTCSSDDLAEGFDEGVEQFVETMKEHQEINLEIVRQNQDFKQGDGEKVKVDIANKITTITKTQEGPPGVSREKESQKDVGPDPNKPPCKKAKQLRIERKFEKLKKKGIDAVPTSNTCKNKEKQLEDFIKELPDDLKHKLEIKLVRTSPPSVEWLATAKQTHEVYLKYQTVIHDDKPHRVTQSKFAEFLLTSPLEEEYSDDGPACGYGSFHQQYWLDSKLIAVGVIDILPKCISSVYFFYDPKYMALGLGTYGALREIEFTRKIHLECPQIEYYYMGYYIHSCPKMRYKGNFSPSDLLCPETYKWFPLLDSIPKLEAAPYSRLNHNIDSVDDNFPKENDLNSIMIWSNGAVMSYTAYKKRNDKKDGNEQSINNDLIEYMRLVGAKTAKSLILVK